MLRKYRANSCSAGAHAKLAGTAELAGALDHPPPSCKAQDAHKAFLTTECGVPECDASKPQYPVPTRWLCVERAAAVALKLRPYLDRFFTLMAELRT